MKEKLYTIPVNEAFEADSECPLCSMYQKLETDAIEFTMGPSYMEDDIREATTRLGFCGKHLEQLYQHQNRLGLALILKTHMDKLIADVGKLSSDKGRAASSFFRKKGEISGIVSHIGELEQTCFVCDKIDRTFERYIATVFYLYHTEEAFRNQLKGSKGFCTGHYKLLYDAAPTHLRGEELEAFLQIISGLYLENMERVRDDLEWFINKFDYRYAQEPWKNAKDALPRAMQKTNSI